MTNLQHDLSDPALTAAIEANMVAQFALLRFWPPAEVHDDPEMLWTLTPVRFAAFNAVMRAQLAPERADAAIEAAIARCRARDVPMMWTTGPASRPADLGARLPAHGFTLAATAPGMAADLATLPEALPATQGLSLATIGDGAGEGEWYDTMARAYEMPAFVEVPMREWLAGMRRGAPEQLRHYLGRLFGAPVAVGTLFLGAGVAGIYQVGVVAEARRQGIGAALTLAAMREARALGYRVAVLRSSLLGLSVYRQLGFWQYCRFEHYVWQA
jgi:GNAT superfamily N-acetyltransferase